MIALQVAIRGPNVVLDWSSARHYAALAAPCRICHQPTNSRDDDLRPRHKVCAKATIAAAGR